MKIQQAAKAAGSSELEFCDGVSQRFRVGALEAIGLMNVKYEFYKNIRGTALCSSQAFLGMSVPL
jgi:hypothetical protein